MAIKKRKGGNKGVQYTRDELSPLLPQYFTIRDCIEGEPAIKGMIPGSYGTDSYGTGFNGQDSASSFVLARALRYLPMPNPSDQSEDNRKRYRQYVIRAVFYNVCARTIIGMIGQVFLRPPKINVPSQLHPMLTNIDGCGLTERQLAKRAVKDVLAYGRLGILVDFPQRTRPTSRADIASGTVQPTITVYYPWDIINWRTQIYQGKKYLTLVVLRENVSEEGDDGFELVPVEQYRVLRFDPDTQQHTVEIWRPLDADNKTYGQASEFTPLSGNGKPLSAIPFMFVGSESNDEVPDKPPMYDIASLNVAHYRNSADYEESVYMMGQPTLAMTGLSQDWVTNVLKGSVKLGSRRPIPLPVGADAKLLEAKPNNLAQEAMLQKEQQMVALGAKLVEKMTVQRTATETIVESTSETSILLSCADNVSAAFTWAFGICAGFLNIPPGDISYLLNKDYELTKMSPQDRDSVIQTWMSKAITFDEMRTALHTGGLATDNSGSPAVILQIIKESEQFIKAGVMAPAVPSNGKNPSAQAQARPGQNPADNPVPNS